MTGLLIFAVIAWAAVACVKAYCSARLLEKDAAAWERLQQAEEQKRRQRQETLGHAALNAVRWASRLLNKKE